MNKKPVLNLVQIDLDRLPGLSQPFVVPAQPGINLIYGANEAGKTSVARAIAQLLWPNNKVNKPFEVGAVFRDSRGDLRAKRQDADPVSWLRDGIDAPGPDLPGEHLAACYRLGLLDLNRLGSDDLDDSLAAEIRQQMAGGFDLSAVAQLFPAPSNRRSAERGKWDRAKTDLVRCEARHRDLSEQERGLASLIALQEQAQRSDTRADQYATALEHLALAEDQDSLITSLASLPTGMKFVHEGDDKQWQELAQLIQTKSEQIADLKKTIDQRADRLGPLNAPANLTERSLLVHKVRELAQENGGLELAVAEAAARHETALGDIAPELLAAEIPLQAEDAFQKLAESHRELSAQQSRQEHWTHLSNLALWRETGSEPKAMMGWWPVVAGAIEVLSALAILLWAGVESLPTLAQGLLLVLAADGVFRVSRWRPSGRSAAGAQIQNEIAHQKQQAEAAVTAAASARRDLLRDLGQSEHRNDHGLLQELDRVARARTTAEALAGAQERHEHNIKALSSAVATAVSALEAEGALEVTASVVGVQAALENLTQQKAQAEGLLEAQTNDINALAQAEGELSRATTRQNELRERFDFSEEVTDYQTALNERMAALPQHQTWSRDLDNVRRSMVALGEKLNPADAQLSASDLGAYREEALQQAANHTALTSEIAGLRERIKLARQGDELAKARALEAESTADLNDLLESRRDAALGRLFLDNTVHRHESNTLPPLLTAMNALLNTFTQGLYNLRVTATGFVAIDNQGDQRSLRELSDGTRAHSGVHEIGRASCRERV